MFIVFREGRAKQVIEAFGTHLHIDLQQRGVEFSQLFREYSHLRPALLEKMPKIQKSLPNGNDSGGIYEEHSNDLLESGGDEPEGNGIISNSVNKIGTDALLDLLGGVDDPAESIDLVSSVTVKASTTSSSNNQDLLDLLGGLDLPSSTPPAAINPLGGGGIGLDLNSLNDNSIKTTTVAPGAVTGSTSFGGLENLLNSNTTPSSAVMTTIPVRVVSPTSTTNVTSGVFNSSGNNTSNNLFNNVSAINNNEV